MVATVQTGKVAPYISMTLEGKNSLRNTFLEGGETPTNGGQGIMNSWLKTLPEGGNALHDGGKALTDGG